MKLIKIAKSFEQIQSLVKYKFTSYEKSRAIYLLYKQIEKEFNYYGFEEQKILNEYAKKDERGIIVEDKRIFFETVEKKSQYETEIQKLMEIEIEIEPITLTKEDISDIPTPEIMIALEEIVIFE